MSPLPKITSESNNARMAIHNNKIKVYIAAAPNFANTTSVRLTGFVSSSLSVPMFASPEIRSPDIMVMSKGTCTSNNCNIMKQMS